MAYLCIFSWTKQETETSKEEKGRELFIYHYDYPVVVSVEPGSPAEEGRSVGKLGRTD